MVYARSSVRAREQFDWPLFLGVVAIAIIGVVNLYSATSPYLDDPRRSALADMYVQQVYWLVIGGTMILTACGRTTSRSTNPRFRPRAEAASVWPWLTAWMPLRTISPI